MHESWCDNELRLSNLVKNENELLWSSTNNVILVVYPIKFVFSYVSYSGNSARVILDWGLHRINKSSGQFGFYLGHMGQFGSLQFRVGAVLGRFNFEFRVEISSTLSHVASGLISSHSIRVIWFELLLRGLIMNLN